MKRLLSLIAVFAVIACSKTTRMQEVVFSPSYVETGSMTRATDHAEILSLIESSYTSFAVEVFTNGEGNSGTIMEFGRTYTIPVGTFRVNGATSITPTGTPNAKYTLAKSPLFYVDTYVTIQYGTYDYSLPVQVRSAGVLFDRNDVSQIKYKDQSGSYVTIPNANLVLSDNYGLFFINGYFDGTPQVCVDIIPKTGAHKETEFIFAHDEVSTGSATYVKLESGKYYVLHPSGITELTGSFSLSIPSWECGLE